MKPFRHVRLFIVSLALALSGLGIASTSASEVADESAPPELRGILFLSGSRQFALTTQGGAESGWASIGDTFDGWKLAEFREEGEVLVVSDGERSVELHLAESQVLDAQDDRATLKDAEAVMEKMNFEDMFEKMIEQQRANVMKMTRQMHAQHGAANGPSADEVAEFQGKVMDLMWSEMNPKQMASDMAQIYSEVFSRSELRGLSDFYSTPAGRAMIDKQPVIQERLMGLMQPRMMAVMPQIQQMAQEFEREQRERRAAPGDGGAEGGGESQPAP